MEKICNCRKLAQKNFGPVQCRLLMRRLDELRAADTLEVLRYLPHAHCHELTGKREGQLSVDLKHPYRLIFEPADYPIPLTDDEGIDWKRVTTIRILEVEDTHG